MPIDGHMLRELIERELSTVSDERVVSYIRSRLIEPFVIPRAWDYGEKGQQYPCWMVFKDIGSTGEIGYCEFGFGPRCPWGLISSGITPEDQSMGMDSGWFVSFLDAFFESVASVKLPIWRVFNQDKVFNGEVPWPGTALTDEGEWEATWKKVEEFRKNNPKGRYFAGHSITYAKVDVWEDKMSSIVEESCKTMPSDMIDRFRRVETPLTQAIFPGYATFVIVAKRGNKVLFYDDIEGEFGTANLEAHTVKNYSLYGELQWALADLLKDEKPA